MFKSLLFFGVLELSLNNCHFQSIIEKNYEINVEEWTPVLKAVYVPCLSRLDFAKLLTNKSSTTTFLSGF